MKDIKAIKIILLYIYALIDKNIMKNIRICINKDSVHTFYDRFIIIFNFGAFNNFELTSLIIFKPSTKIDENQRL